jgi:hypothetical protein
MATSLDLPSVTIIPAHAVTEKDSKKEKNQSSNNPIYRSIISATPSDQYTGWKKLGWEENDLQYATQWFTAVPERWRALQGRNDPDGVSHRVMEWFVVNYSKAYNVSYDLNGKQFNVYNSYRNYMSSLLKVRFDMFCRTGLGKGRTGMAIIKTFDDITKEHLEIATNLRQMNFYKWAITHGVLDYAKRHKDLIAQDMKKTLSKKRPRVLLPDGTVKIKRRKLKEPVHVVRHVKQPQKIIVC